MVRGVAVFLYFPPHAPPRFLCPQLHRPLRSQTSADLHSTVAEVDLTMASAGDVRDIFNLGAGPRQPAPKKKKRVETKPRPAGISKEVQALMGDSVPPVAILEQKQYKQKPSIAQKLFKPRRWDERQFSHKARDDGLSLRHWKRSIPNTVRAHAITTPTDVEMSDSLKEALDIRYEDEFPSEKWDVKPEIPSYSDEVYESNFKSEDWTREETDYLMELCREYTLRWIIIADRYDSESIQTDQSYPPRTTEQMKARYYTIAAKTLETQTPASNMTSVEFQLWEKMKNFDAKTETLRKEQVKKLFERTKDEAEEERMLLEELHRITKNEEDFIRLRRDLYSRLESAPAIRRTERGEEQSTAMYQTSQGLSMLLQTLLAKERKLKRPMANGEQATPVDPRRGQPNQYSRRETMESQDGGPQKKGSVTAPNVRTLSAAEELKFGVAHPTERLTSGVQFRHEKINRLTLAKSQSQTSKIQVALAELGVPSRLVMPTERVCRKFERLINALNILLDARKTSDRVADQIRVLEQTRRLRLGETTEGEVPSGDAMEVDASQVTEDPKSDAVNESTVVEDTQMDDEEQDEDAEGEQDDVVDDSMAQVDEQEDEDFEGGEDGEEEEEASQEEDEEEPQLGQDEDEDVDEAEAEEDLGGDDAEVEESEEEQAEVDDSDGAGSEEADGNGEAESEAEEPDAGTEDEEEPSRPSTSHSAAAAVHKRSASVISDASKAGSNRSGLGRKKRR